MNESKTLRLGLHGIGVAFAVLVIVAGYFLGYVPRMLNSREVDREEERVSMIEASLPRVRARNASIRAECERLDQELDRLRKGIPGDPQEHELLRSFSELAVAADLRMLDFSPAPAGEESGFGVTSMQVGFRGTYAGTCALLWKLDQMARLHRITSVTIRLVDLERDIFEIRFSLQAFHVLGTPVTITQGDEA